MVQRLITMPPCTSLWRISRHVLPEVDPRADPEINAEIMYHLWHVTEGAGVCCFGEKCLGVPSRPVASMIRLWISKGQ